MWSIILGYTELDVPHGTDDQRTKNLIFAANPWSSAKIEHGFRNKGVLKLKLPKIILTNNVLLNSYSSFKKNRKIRMIFDVEFSL